MEHFIKFVSLIASIFLIVLFLTFLGYQLMTLLPSPYKKVDRTVLKVRTVQVQDYQPKEVPDPWADRPNHGKP